MSRTRYRSLDDPDESLAFDHGRIDWVVIGGSDDRPNDPGTGLEMVDAHPTDRRGEWCQSRHVGMVVSGRMHIVTDDGDEFDLGPYDVIDVAPGHDAWVLGDEPVISIEWSGVRGWLEPLESLNERVLATVVVTDIVDSTGHATRLGGEQVERSPRASQRPDAGRRDDVSRPRDQDDRRWVPRRLRRCGPGDPLRQEDGGFGT